MITLAIIAAAIILIALLRVGVYVEYSDEGISLKVHVGPFYLRILPAKEKKKGQKKRGKKKTAKVRKKDRLPKEKKPGGYERFAAIVKAAADTLGRLRRRLLIKRITIHYIAASDDPSKAAKAFGMANAAFGTVVPVLDRIFRIKRKDFRASADFSARQPSIYVDADISLAVWEAIYISLAILPLILKQAKLNASSLKKAKLDATSQKKAELDASSLKKAELGASSPSPAQGTD